MEETKEIEEYLKNVTIPMVGVYDGKTTLGRHFLSPVATTIDFQNGYYAGHNEDGNILFRHYDDIMDFSFRNDIVDPESKSVLETLKHGDVLSFELSSIIVKVTTLQTFGNEIYYRLQHTGIHKLKKINNRNAIKKLVGMWEKRLQRYILTTKQKSFEELFTSSIKDMILIGASPNTAGVYLACLLYQGDTSFYVDDIQTLTGWSEEDIKKGLNELEELGEVLVDPVYELVDDEYLPPYFHQN